MVERTVYGIYAEWDGFDGVVFETAALAKAWAKRQYELFEVDEEFEDVWDDLIGTEPFTLYEKEN